MAHKRSGSPLAKLRMRAGLDQAEVAAVLGIGGGKTLVSWYETGRELLPAEHVIPLATLYRVTEKRLAWAAVRTFRGGVTMEKYRAIREIAVDSTSA